MDDNSSIGKTEQYFINFLASKNLRLTSQRKIIFNELITRETHADVDELLYKMKALDKNIGLATIYRTLKLLIEAGIVREVKFGNEKPVYEAVMSRSHHDHLICTNCGKNIEFLDDEIERQQEEIAKKYGYKLTGHSMYLMGICPECLKIKNTGE